MAEKSKAHIPVVTATKPQRDFYKNACGCGAVDTEEGTIHEDNCPAIQRPSNLTQQCLDLYKSLNSVEQDQFKRTVTGLPSWNHND